MTTKSEQERLLHDCEWTISRNRAKWLCRTTGPHWSDLKRFVRLYDMVLELRAEVAALRDDKEQAVEALQKICAWAEAYPLEVFPEPDFKLVRKALEAYGISLDQVSASNMRHVITHVSQIAIDGLISRRELPAPPESEE